MAPASKVATLNIIISGEAKPARSRLARLLRRIRR